MSLLEWNSSLDVHVDSMNREHSELIRLMNVVYDANAAASGKEQISSALDALVDYTVKHFEDEEAYMESINFSGLRSHKYIHQDLLKRVSGFVSDYKSSTSDQLPNEFFEFLKFWLVSHIQGIDTKYGNA